MIDTPILVNNVKPAVPETASSEETPLAVSSVKVKTPKYAKNQVRNPAREHIFKASVIEPLAIQWKAAKAANQPERSNEMDYIMEQIIVGSSNMYSAMMLKERFHLSIPHDELLSMCQTRTPHWVNYWQPNLGPLFTWLSVCANREMRGEIKRKKLYDAKCYSTSDTLENFSGNEEHEVLRQESAKLVQDRLQDLTCRWASKEAQGIIRFYIQGVQSLDKINKRELIRAGCYAWMVPPAMAKFYYQWTLIALRNTMMEKARIPYTEQDLFRLRHTYTLLPDMLNIITWKQMLQLMAVMGGQRIKIPTLNSINDLKKRARIAYSMLNKPESIDPAEDVAEDEDISEKSAQQIFEDMAFTMGVEDDGEYNVYS